MRHIPHALGVDEVRLADFSDSKNALEQVKVNDVSVRDSHSLRALLHRLMIAAGKGSRITKRAQLANKLPALAGHEAGHQEEGGG